MREVSLKDLLEAGCHFGHKTSRWHPNAEPYIFEARGNIHIIDLAKTKEQLEKAAEEVQKIASRGGKVLFIGTKRQAVPVIRMAAKEAGLPYMTNRWVGGLITNWEQVRKNIDKMNRMEKEEDEGEWNTLPKHEQLELAGELAKLKRVYGGVADLTELPQAVYIVDVRREKTAVREALQAGLTSIGLCDTNSDPRLVSIPIPANDDAVGSVEYITNYLADAYMSGKSKTQNSKGKATAKKEKDKR